jgi:dienelactone hydrolase
MPPAVGALAGRRPAAIAVGLAVLALAGFAATARGAGKLTDVRLREFRFVDHSRRAHFRDGTSRPRILVTDVRYPTQGRGPFPLIVFAHGFALTPLTYARLLDTWARAGYIVAAPIFPVENANAPGGPDESDLENQPRDMSFVISRLVAPTSPIRELVDARKIAVAGHSDGAETSLTVAYDRRFRDRRIDAAIVLSGAALPGFTTPPAGSPPLLAVQGTSDPTNVPAMTASYYRWMHRPKFLLWLLGATHLAPYTTSDRWLTVVERTTTIFLDHFLRGAPLQPLIAAGTRAGTARILPSP